MKKGKKAAIIIIAVIAAAAIVVGGLVLGGVIPVGNKRTASAQEIAVDDTAMTAYKTIPQVYKITLKSLYGMSADDVAKFYENNCEGWNVYAQTVSIKNRSDTAIVISNAKSEANGTDNIWVCSRTNEANYVTIAPAKPGHSHSMSSPRATTAPTLSNRLSRSSTRASCLRRTSPPRTSRS